MDFFLLTCPDNHGRACYSPHACKMWGFKSPTLFPDALWITIIWWLLKSITYFPISAKAKLQLLVFLLLFVGIFIIVLLLIFYYYYWESIFFPFIVQVSCSWLSFCLGFMKSKRQQREEWNGLPWLAQDWALQKVISLTDIRHKFYIIIKHFLPRVSFYIL